jgi:hypothetical protein
MNSTAVRLKGQSDAGLIPGVLTFGGSQSISGQRYCASIFADGSSALMVDRHVIDYSEEPITHGALEAWAHAGRILTSMTKEQIAESVRKHHPGCNVASISGVRWSSDGDYLGLEWR